MSYVLSIIKKQLSSKVLLQQMALWHRKGCLCSSTLGSRLSALRPQPLGPQNIARLNTILLFNFEVAITLKN